MKICTNCTLPETHETITFDGRGLCSVCINSNKKDNVNWLERESELKK